MLRSNKLSLLALCLTVALVLMDGSQARPRAAKITPASAMFLRPSRSNVSPSGKSSQAPHLKLRNVPASQTIAEESSSIVLECEAGGSPPPVIHWLKNGRLISNSDRESNLVTIENEQIEPVGILGLSFTRSKLFLDCVTELDEAIYTCVAENSFSRVSSDSKVQVTRRMNSEAEKCEKRETFGTPARINMWSKTRLEMIGSEVQLFCRSSGFPKPEIEWIGPDGMPITTFDRFEITRTGDLLIKDLTWSDMGGYTCMSTNENGQDHSVAFLYPTSPEKKK